MDKEAAAAAPGAAHHNQQQAQQEGTTNQGAFGDTNVAAHRHRPPALFRVGAAQDGSGNGACPACFTSRYANLPDMTRRVREGSTTSATPLGGSAQPRHQRMAAARRRTATLGFARHVVADFSTLLSINQAVLSKTHAMRRCPAYAGRMSSGRVCPLCRISAP